MLKSVHKTRVIQNGYRIFTMYQKGGTFYAFHVDIDENMTPSDTVTYISGSKSIVRADILLKTGENLDF